MPTNADLQFRAAIANEENVLLQQAKRDGTGFVASGRTTVTANGGRFNLHLKNPADSSHDINVESIFVRTRFQGAVDVFDTFTNAPSGGTANGVDNLKMDTGNTTGETNMVVNEDVTFTSDNTHIKDVLPSGGAGGQVGGEATETEPLIEPGREIVVDVTNESGSDDKAAISIVFVEEQREA